MTTKSDVIALAEKMESATVFADALAMANTPTDVERRVTAAANYRIAQDKRAEATEAYRKAFDAWSAAGYPE